MKKNVPMKHGKPKCALIGENGNIFNLVGIARQTLIRAGLRAKASEMQDRVFASGSYEDALCVIMDYVHIC